MLINSTQALGNGLFTYCHYLSEIIEHEIYKDDRYQNEPESFYYLVLHKLRNLLDTASFLVTNMEVKPHYIDALQLILRTCLLDCINLLFVLDGEDDSEMQSHRISYIMSDHVKSIYNSENSEDIKAEIIKHYPEYFENSKIKAAYKDNLTSKKMISQIVEGSFKNLASELYDIYQIFSKIEHNGAFSFSLLHKNFTPQGLKQSVGIVVDAIGDISIVVNTILFNWVDQENGNYAKLFSFQRGLMDFKKSLLMT